MQIIVTPHTITLNKTEIVNEGEYNINTCEFELSEEYIGLTNMAIFTNETSTFKTMIVDNQCIIPYEVLEQEGTLMVGVYGYECNGDNLVKRYSPTPVAFYVEKGSYALAQEGEQPSPSVIEQMQHEIEKNTNDITIINNTLPTLATKEELPTKTSELINDSNFAYESDIPDVSNFITKDVDDLTNYTPTEDLSEVATTGDYEDLTNTPDLSIYATTQALGTETTNRENADINLQGQIDAITSSSDVKDIVGTYQELQNYDTSTLGNDDIVKVLQDSTHNDAMTYYRWVITSGTGAWNYIGQEGPYYTKSEIDTELTDYVKNTNYATSQTAGVIKSQSSFNFGVNESGIPYAENRTYAQYQTQNNTSFIGKGTLENVIAGKDLTTKAYVDGLVGDINTALDTINGEVI